MSKNKPNNPPAFPSKSKQEVGRSGPMVVYEDVDTAGMTLRDWFAGHFLAGIMTRESGTQAKTNYLAKKAYQIADALLAERAKDEEE